MSDLTFQSTFHLSSILHIENKILIYSNCTSKYSGRGLCDSIKETCYSGQKKKEKWFVNSQHMTILSKVCFLSG